MNTIKFALAAAALAGVSACNIPFSSDYVYPMSIAAAGPAISDEIRTAAPGEVILAQAIAHAGFLQLDNAVTPNARVWQGVVTYHPRLEPGLRLFPAVRVGDVRGRVLCSIDAIARREGGVGLDAYPVCFDISQGGLVSVPPGNDPPANATNVGGSLWLTETAQATTGFVYVNLAGQLAQGAEGPNFTLTQPAHFSVAPAPEGAPASGIRVALRYVADATGARLESIYLTGEQQVLLDRQPVPISATDPFPRIVETGGARIELLAIRDGVLAYRVRRNFPSDRVAIADLPG